MREVAVIMCEDPAVSEVYRYRVESDMVKDSGVGWWDGWGGKLSLIEIVVNRKIKGVNGSGAIHPDGDHQTTSEK